MLCFYYAFAVKMLVLCAAVIYIIVVYKTDRENFQLFEGLNISVSTGKKEEPHDDATCKAANKDYPKWMRTKKCVAESMGQREGMKKSASAMNWL